jgi:hypothetical protein
MRGAADEPAKRGSGQHQNEIAEGRHEPDLAGIVPERA